MATTELPCPACGAEVVPAPTWSYYTPGRHPMTMRPCPACDEPLIYWWRGPLAGAWRIDEPGESIAA